MALIKTAQDSIVEKITTGYGSGDANYEQTIKKRTASIHTFVWHPSDQDVSYDKTHPWCIDRRVQHIDFLNVTNQDGKEVKICLKQHGHTGFGTVANRVNGELFDALFRIHETLKNQVNKWYLIAIRGQTYATVDDTVFINTQNIFFTRYDKAVEKYGFKSEDPVAQVGSINDKRLRSYLAGLSGDFKCTSCVGRYETQRTLDKHVIIRHGTVQCDLCKWHGGTTFTQNTEEDMLNHKEKSHYKCPDCNDWFFDKKVADDAEWHEDCKYENK